MESRESDMKSEEELCKELIGEVFQIRGVRYATVVDGYGNRILGGMKPGVETVAPPEIETRREMQSIFVMKMAEDYEKYFDKSMYTIVGWKRLHAVYFLLSRSRALSLTIENQDLQQALPRLELVV